MPEDTVADLVLTFRISASRLAPTLAGRASPCAWLNISVSRLRYNTCVSAVSVRHSAEGRLTSMASAGMALVPTWRRVQRL